MSESENEGQRERLQRAALYLARLRQSGPRPLTLPAELAPRDPAEAYRLQQQVALTLAATIGGWKVAMSGPDAGSYAPVYAADIHHSGATVHSPIREQLGIEPEVAFTLKRALPTGRHYSRADVIDAIGSAHAAIEILVSRFQRHETAALLDRLADNISNGGLVLGPPLEAWHALDFAGVALTMTLTPKGGARQLHHSHGGHPQGDPLLPVIWLANERAAQGIGLRAGEVITTGSFAGLRYAQRGTHIRVEFAGLGAVELYG